MNSEQIRQEVTDRVVALLESGNISKWVRPWVQYGTPRNLGTGRKYSGLLNILLLQQVSMDAEYKLPLWATYHQVQTMGANVLKGERAARVVLWKELGSKVVPEETGEPSEPNSETKLAGRKNRFMLQYFYVFNVEQTTLDVENTAAKLGLTMRDNAPVEQLEAFVKSQKIEIIHGGDRACYSKFGDSIQMPILAAFNTPQDYYSTVFHELVHASGHEARLNRDLSGKFGSDEYAREELIAELGSLYVCAELGLEGKLQHPEYLHSWIEVLKSDSREIFKIAGKAKEAVDFLLTQSQVLESASQIAS